MYFEFTMGYKRKKVYRTGIRAELVASFFLTAKGYRILAHRYKTPVGEIDLVVRKKARLAFVEVKGRSGVSEALFAVSPKQQRRIKRAAGYWLAKQPCSYVHEIGFDIVAIVPWKIPRHYEDAFSHTFY
jgi:putative endonuclease